MGQLKMGKHLAKCRALHHHHTKSTKLLKLIELCAISLMYTSQMAVWQHIYHCVSGLSSVSSENSLGGIANSITDGNLYQKRRFKGLS